MQNLAGFGLKPSARFFGGGVCFYALHGYVQNSSGFTFPHTYPPKTHPILPFPIRIPQNQPGFRPKPSSRGFSGRMQYAPTRVREKFDGFHISAHEYAKNAPDFTLPNKDIPKSCPILDPNLRRGTFRGVCFCAPTRVQEKPVRFHISTHVPTKNAPDFILSNKDTPKTRPILYPKLRRGFLGGVCFCALHGYVKNLADFRPKPSAQDISGRMQYAPTRVHPKPTRF